MGSTGLKLTNLKVIGISLASGTALGVGGGWLYAVLADKVVWHGIGTVLFVVGILALGVGLSGATEPAEGWSSKRAKHASGRRSLAARLAPDEQNLEITSGALAAWALLVGIPLIALSMIAFWAAA